MSFSTPPGFAQRATWRDDSLPHQVRIVYSRGAVWVSCTCKATGTANGAGRDYQPVVMVKPGERAMDKWEAFHAEEGIDV